MEERVRGVEVIKRNGFLLSNIINDILKGIDRGEPLSKILEKCEGMRANCMRAKENILARFGALDGNRECAKIFANDFLKNIA